VLPVSSSAARRAKKPSSLSVTACLARGASPGVCLVAAFLDQRIESREFVDRARIVAFDGRDQLGQLRLEIWDDNFSATFRPKGYEADSKVGG